MPSGVAVTSQILCISITLNKGLRTFQLLFHCCTVYTIRSAECCQEQFPEVSVFFFPVSGQSSFSSTRFSASLNITLSQRRISSIGTNSSGLMGHGKTSRTIRHTVFTSKNTCNNSSVRISRKRSCYRHSACNRGIRLP